MSLFSPAELIAKAHSQGSTYPDSTLRTHIVSIMCKNAPVNHATTYGDLERVSRGLYKLTAGTPTQTAATSAAVHMAVAPPAEEVRLRSTMTNGSGKATSRRRL
jgi:hypothetical protein